MTWRVEHADCIEVMRELDEASIDAVVCDPPYGLEFMGKEWDRLIDRRDSRAGKLAGQESEGGRTTDPYISKAVTYEGGIVAQEWHHAWATEALRVLKPGGHLLAFGGTRTYHRLACAVEDAGFEIRDSLIWLYGSGFPKSLDVSKAIDKVNGRTDTDQHRLAAHIRERRQAAGVSVAEMASWFPQYREITKNWERTDKHGARVPTLADWHVLRAKLGLSDEHLPLIEREEAERERVGDGQGAGSRGNTFPLAPEYDLTAPATPEAEKWQGWGTALKPAHEPIVVARKPLTGTVSANVLEHGTGALNVDGCRVNMSDKDREAARVPQRDHHGYAELGDGEGRSGERFEPSQAGRWPANVTLSHLPECGYPDPFHSPRSETAGEEPAIDSLGRSAYGGPDLALPLPDAEGGCAPGCPVAELDRQSGELKSGSGKRRPHKWSSLYEYGGNGPSEYEREGDTGGASRFFYVAKASRAERNAGLPEGERSSHPTVKPIDLMRWLVRLVTLPGGTCLDPFCGSGTTGIACVLEDFDFIGVEREAEYVEIAKARIAHWASQPKQLGLEVL